MSDGKITRLEHLPNELFYYLFSHFEVRHLYQTFRGLHSRLNALLFNLTDVYLCINGPDDQYDETADYSSRITHVRIRNECPNISFRSFRYTVHSMFVDRMSNEQIQELSQLLYLKHLKVGSIHSYWSTIPWVLGSLRLTITSALPNLMAKSLVNLSSISIPIFTPSNFCTVLDATPNLIHLNMSIIRDHRSPTPAQVAQIYVALLRLRIDWYIGFNNSDLNFYFSQVPYLEYLHLSIWPCIVLTMEQVYEIFNKIGSSIDLHLPYLCRFSFSIKIHVKHWCSFDLTRLNSVFTQRIHLEQCGHRLIVSNVWTRSQFCQIKSIV